MKNFLIYVMIFIVSISISACTKKIKKEDDFPVINESQLYSCGKIERNIDLEKESIKYTAYKNQFILTRNLIKLDSKLKEAYSIIDCYEKQINMSNTNVNNK